ncbi:30S ribosome-binding factor RbfA [Desulfovibrio aminophilus]|nr:30S ribosome-binding factor RbfA [Desulfovibrio aminophilus]MCM0755219.1 30S ribosome-binding factor RbfA [Desulfovibrio aminophilus]
MKTTDSRRSVRLGDQILRELAGMLLEEIQDPRLEMITLSAVRMNKDLRIAEVFFTLPAGDDRLKDAEAALAKCTGRLRGLLGKRLKLRYLPELRFVHDTFLEDMVYAKPHPGNLGNPEE